ncbi:MAG: FAD-dependent oxidoreductase, partial [Deltaproteobacteria bacterium]|nr:FAD-dependent oxidoreductase [Deltaproteobacteria bacterium]
HTFIMEGAREVQQNLKEQGIRHVFYLGRQPAKPTPLRSLARRAALVITEDFPAPPLPQWTRQLAAKVDTAVWAVDCACIIPMRQINRAFERAYAFRNHTQKEYERRLAQSWQDMTPAGQFFKGDCGFDAIDLANADIAELCAQCQIDHTIPPVVHTPGGSSAGYARWEQFKRHGLKGYARLRNDAAIAFPQGVSRMSAYLHHGHVSPFRIARDALRNGSDGAAKFLEELLIWRELAHNFCFYHKHLETLEALPRWARQTVIDHLEDPRQAGYCWETLYRAQTGDPLWNAAQRSLLVHGELHNNVRMTWGKAFLNWTQHPQDALDLMIDLNHRLALDGNDANSYGGLLWCLGLFDRPFKPQRPVIGTLRPRSTKDHAKRLDMAAYTAKVKGPVTSKPLKLAVIGAGLSGLFAARALMDHGHRVQVFEKTNRPGGRIVTQNISPYAFDTGAQYFTVRDDRLRRYVESWQIDGIIKPWQVKVQVVKSGRLSDEKKVTERWVGIPAMDAVAVHLAAGIKIDYNVAVLSLTKIKNRWQLTDCHQTVYGPYEAVIIAAPPPEAAGLLKSRSKLRDCIRKVEMQPCLAVMAAFEKPLDLTFDAAFVHDSPVRWAARNSSKPGRPATECWVFHAGAKWSYEQANVDADASVRSLIDLFFKSIGQTPVDPIFYQTRYWGFAAAADPLNVGCLWDAALKIGLCGDWCQMSRFEGAALSGMAMAGRILNMNLGVPHKLRDLNK